MKLEGKVADILSEWEVAINIGSKDGVQKGMRFTVLGEKIIRDPDNHKSLGEYKYKKVSIKISKVNDRYSVGTSRYTTAWGIVSGKSSSTSNVSPYPQVVYDERVTTSEYTDMERNVRKGDIVVED